jgi:hypothetical protein
MTPNNTNVARSIGDAAQAAARLIEQCVDHAVAELQEAEARASGEQRQRIAEAWRALGQRRTTWARRFPQLLTAAFETETGAAPLESAPAPRRAGPTLSLVDDTEINRSIEAARLAQLLSSTLERPLAELDALMSSALGLPGVQPQNNPLRPSVYARVLGDLLAEDEPDPAWTGVWLRSMARPLATGLEQVYRSQAQFFTRQHVNAASYRLRSAQERGGASSAPAPLARVSQPARLAPDSAPAPLSAGSAPGAAGPPLQDLGGERLRQFLLRGEARRALAASYYTQAASELRALEARPDEPAQYDERAVRQHMHVPPVDRPARPVDVDSPLPQGIWGRFSAPRERALVHGRLKTQAREVGQVLGLEVVRRLVNRVADDPRLLGPVREAVVGLEPSLLRLAMVAPRFFSDEQHPGRLLVERVAERSFRYNDEFSVEFQGFFGSVTQAFQRLNAIDPLQSAEPFRAALAALQGSWAAQDALDEEQQVPVLDAVRFAERRQHDADRIATELGLRPDLEGVAEPVREFLLGTWALVIAHARLTQAAGGLDPGGHLAVVSDLLWSARRELTLHDPARAFVLIPRVLLKLRSGLAMLGQQPQDSEAFFQQLEALHRPVMKLRAKKRHGDLALPEPARVPAAPAPQRAPGQPWMAPRELHAVGFEEKPGADPLPLHAAARARQAPAAALDEPAAEQLLAALEPGCWVDLYSRQQWRRARLQWSSERRTLFMFVSHGGQPHSMTRRSLERLVRERLLRPVDAQAVVPRALARLEAPSGPAALSPAEGPTGGSARAATMRA